ncbi:S24 family peptidase [Vreelandella arcis]|uniref:Repressor LexA n=1 Tax=Vreelandella arcis TaxID=416873 RepID=A0A1H0D8W2_9GAMM|nr:S24 family peptidase [Halomonas arcis]SDN66617.1 repressor LexA [Halomonas arcis]
MNMSMNTSLPTIRPTPLPYTTPASDAQVIRRNTYTLMIRGNHMGDCHLFDGDVIVIRRYQHDNQAETIVAEINHQALALKQLSISRAGVRLWLDDAKHSEVFLHNRDIQVLGMFMGIEHHPMTH